MSHLRRVTDSGCSTHEQQAERHQEENPLAVNAERAREQCPYQQGPGDLQVHDDEDVRHISSIEQPLSTQQGTKNITPVPHLLRQDSLAMVLNPVEVHTAIDTAQG